MLVGRPRAVPEGGNPLAVPRPAPDIASEPDHVIVWGDVDRIATELSSTLGVAPDDGGVHPGAGTRNLLFTTRGGVSLEVLGPDPEQPTLPAWAPTDPEAGGTLWWWAVRTDTALQDVRSRLRDAGVATTDIEAGERVRPSGERLTWETVDPIDAALGHAIPFVIRWHDRAPSHSGAGASAIDDLRVLHPDPDRIRRVFAALGLDPAPPVREAAGPGLAARIRGPNGTRRFVSA
jgi:hypothetical protein